MLFKRFLFLILSLCVALANPSQSGRTAGETFLRQYGGEQNKAKRTKEALIDPATHSRGGEKPYITPTGQSLYADPVLCGQGNTSNKVRFLEISVNPSDRRVRINYSAEPYSDRLSESFSYSGRYLCIDGYCNEYDGRYRDCKRLTFDGRFSLLPVDSLDVCVDPQLQPQPPTFYAGKVVELLLDFYRTSGKPLRQMDIQTEGNRAIYFGGKPECRAGVPQISSTYSNPYTLRDQALYYYHSCDPNTDPACSVRSTLSDVSTRSSTCTIERRIEHGQRVCVAGQRIYPDSYTEGRNVCGSRNFSSFQVSLWLECNPDGKGYTLKGWGFWEGAPCGRSDFYPPEVQFSKEVPYGRSFSELLAGRISVNKKVSDASNQCIEPYEVRVSGEGNPNSMTYRVRILGAPACNSFTFSNIRPVKEDIVSNCPNMENCKVINEWWEDANGKRIQVIKGGAPVLKLTGCEEVLWSNEERRWVSHNSGQSPPNNCNYPPKTCRDGECRQWWRKIREYECANSRVQQRPDLRRFGGVLESLRYDSQTGMVSFTDSICRSSGTCERISRTLTDYVCSVDGASYRNRETCLSNCHSNGFCERASLSYRCVYTGQVFSDPQSCEDSCYSAGQCSSVYYCPLNQNRYASQGECLGNCNNCQQRGTCSSETRRSACSQVMVYAPVCPNGYVWNSSLRRCVSNPVCLSGGRFNPDADRCEAGVVCPSGFVWNSQTQRCERGASCPSGSEYRPDVSPSMCITGYRLTEGTYREKTDLTLSEARTICQRGIIYHNGQVRCLFNFNEGNAEGTSYIPAGYVGTIRYNFKVCDDATIYVYRYFYNCIWQGDGYWCVTDWWEIDRSGGHCEGECGIDVNNVPYQIHTADPHYIWFFDARRRECGWLSHCPRDTEGINCASTWANVSPIGQPICPNSNHDPVLNVCFTSYTCPSGYSLANNQCVSNPQCPAGGVYDPNLNLCVSTQNPCPQGHYEPSLNACVYTPSPVASLDRVSDVYGLYANTQCPVGSCTSYYRCPLTGQYHSSLSQCNNQCVRQVYVCSVGGEYNTQEECQNQCSREISSCCELKGFCSSNNMLYDVSVCPNHCKLRHECREEGQYRCVLTGLLHNSFSECDLRCRQGGNCEERSRELELYRCSTTLAEYESQLSCLNACSGGGCSEVNMGYHVGRPESRNCDKKYCVVKQGRELNVVECSGDSCPVGSGRMVEVCKCGDELRSGFGLGIGILNSLEKALKDISCR